MPNQTKPGVSFRETMTGGFMLGETDPRTGEKKGDAAGIKLSIHCDIDILDVYAFINDPQHFAPIKGRRGLSSLRDEHPGPQRTFQSLLPDQ